jgi:hypothetical protein
LQHSPPKKTHTPSKFIGDSSAGAFLTARERIRVCTGVYAARWANPPRGGRKGYRRTGKERSAMRMPGLNAEASLYSSKGHYRAATVAHPNVPLEIVTAQKPFFCSHNEQDCRITCWNPTLRKLTRCQTCCPLFACYAYCDEEGNANCPCGR